MLDIFIYNPNTRKWMLVTSLDWHFAHLVLGSSSKMAPCFKVVSIQHANFNQISYGRQENGRLSLKLVNAMRDFPFQIRYWYETFTDSLQSGGQGLVKIEILLLSIFHQL